MTFFKSAEEAKAAAVFEVIETCICCGAPSVGPTVRYDLVMPGSDKYVHVLLHRDCAFSMAQRMIVDAWPNRRIAKG